MFSGIIFGFQVINDVDNLSYMTSSRPIKSEALRDIIETRLSNEIDQQMLSVVDSPMTCMHLLFCIPKATGRGRLIVDCSLPKGQSVNKYTNQMSHKY